MQSLHSHITQINTNTAINSLDNQTLALTNENSAILRTMLMLSLVLLDKLHKRTNLSLLLIHLRTSLDVAIDRNDSNLEDSIDSIVLKFQNTMSIIFENDKFFGITEFSKIFKRLNSSVLNNDRRSSANLNLFVDEMLCVSESMSDYLHFNGIFNENDILNYEHEKLRNHYLNTSFKRNSSIQEQGENDDDVQSELINNDRLNVVRSEKFLNFHLQRWKLIGLLDTHIFKSNK